MDKKKQKEAKKRADSIMKSLRIMEKLHHELASIKELVGNPVINKV